MTDPRRIYGTERLVRRLTWRLVDVSKTMIGSRKPDRLFLLTPERVTKGLENELGVSFDDDERNYIAHCVGNIRLGYADGESTTATFPLKFGGGRFVRVGFDLLDIDGYADRDPGPRVSIAVCSAYDPFADRMFDVA